MASVLSAARDRVAALAVTAFGISGNNRLMDVAVAAKTDWRDLMERVEKNASAVGIAPPYAVMAFAPAQQVDGALRSTTFDQIFHILYVASLRNGSTAIPVFTVRTTIEDELLQLQQAVFNDTSGSIQCWDCQIDLDENNPANNYYGQFQIPLYAGILTMTIQTGDTL